MLDIDIKGKMKAIDMIGYMAAGSSSKVTAMNLEENIRVIIITMFSISMMGATEKSTFLPRLTPRATTVLIAIGNPN
jgi:hypothetical protein